MPSPIRPVSLLLLVIPIFMLLVADPLSRARGPHWLTVRQSPDYAHLLNSLSLLETGRAANIANHPGAPIALVGALTLGILRGQTTSDNFRTAVLALPESYLGAIRRTLAWLAALSLCFLGFAAFYARGSLLTALLFQISPLLSFTLLEAVTRVSAEPFLFAVVCALLGTGLLFQRKQTTAGALFTGVLLAAGITAKLSFLPLLLLPLGWLRERRDFAKAAVGFSATLAALLFPLRGTLASVFENAFRLVTHRGSFGTGEPSMFDFQQTATFLRYLPSHHPTVFAITVTGTVAVIVLAFLADKNAKRSDSRLAVWLSLSFLAQLAMVARVPGEQYLLPALVLIGPLLACVAARRETYALAASVTLVLVALAATPRWLVQMDNERRWRLVVHSIPDKLLRNGAVVMSCNFASSPEFAVHKGDFQSGAKYSANLRDLYPDARFCDINRPLFGGWTAVSERANSGDQSFLVHGPPNESDRLSELLDGDVTDLAHGAAETMYLVEPRRAKLPPRKGRRELASPPQGSP